MKRTFVILLVSALAAVLWTVTLPGNPSSYKPKRINKVIELLEADQPVYFTATTGEKDYADGVAMARTYADYIDYGMEHEEFDMPRLRRFMKGLVDGGPTESGHRTPPVVVTLPVVGLDEATTRANYWVIQQVLGAGVHGIMFCHARTPGAVRALVEAARYPFHRQGVGQDGLGEGLRGSGSQGFASQIWGLSSYEYLEKADFWPLNPQGEVILGLKIEDKYALENAEKVAAVPGVTYAEWGPGDMAMSLVGLYRRKRGEAYPEVLRQARERVMAACKNAGIIFMGSGTNPDNVEEKLQQGVMITRASEATAEKGRKLTNREMPW